METAPRLRASTEHARAGVGVVLHGRVRSAYAAQLMQGPVSAAKPFAGRRAIVTGAGRGIGRGVALALVAAGAEVIAIARSAADLVTLTEETDGSVSGVIADVRDAETIINVISRAEGDFLVTAAGINRPASLTDIPLVELEAILDINIKGTLFACRAFGCAALSAGRPGAVVTVSSQMERSGTPDESRTARASTR